MVKSYTTVSCQGFSFAHLPALRVLQVYLKSRMASGMLKVARFWGRSGSNCVWHFTVLRCGEGDLFLAANILTYKYA